MDYHPKEILVTAVYLATKVEEFNVSIRKTSFLSSHCLYFILLHIRNQWFWQNFIISMCGIKFGQTHENLWFVYKKLFFRNLALFKFTFSKSTSQRDENFFLQIWRIRYQKNLKKSSFHTDFKNVNLVFVKCTQKSFWTKLFVCTFYWVYWFFLLFSLALKNFF